MVVRLGSYLTNLGCLMLFIEILFGLYLVYKAIVVHSKVVYSELIYSFREWWKWISFMDVCLVNVYSTMWLESHVIKASYLKI